MAALLSWANMIWPRGLACFCVPYPKTNKNGGGGSFGEREREGEEVENWGEGRAITMAIILLSFFLSFFYHAAKRMPQPHTHTRAISFLVGRGGN